MILKTHLTKVLFSSIVVLAFFQVGLLFQYQQITSLFKKEQSTNQPFHEDFLALPIHFSYFAKKEFFDEAFEEGASQKPIVKEKIYGAILPHHLIVRDKIAAVFLGLEKQPYKTVVLIGPNHYNEGNASVITSEARWETPYGWLDPDLPFIRALTKNLIATIDEKPFEIEHSVSSLVSFIKKSFPNAKLVPIILKENLSKKEMKELVDFLTEKIDPENTLMLASVDFSHYQPVDVANFHDTRTASVIENFDFERIPSLEVDSPNSLFFLLSYLEKISAEKSQFLFHTNSGTLVDAEDDPTTSHQMWIFSHGEKPKNAKVVSTLFFGDVMLDRNIKTIIQKTGFDNLLSKIAGEEKRFFRGVDIINIANNHNFDQGRNGFEETKKQLQNMDFIFSGCPDGEVGECSDTIIKVGDIKIGMMGFSMVYQTFDLIKVEDRVKNLKAATDVVIVNIHWGREYEHDYTKTQKNIAHALVDAGADAIIGHHPHVVQGMETYHGKPIFYSLGNFIFDQYFSEDTQEGLAVGINFFVPLNHGGTESTKKDKKNIDYQISLFPFISQKSQVELMRDERKKLFFDKFFQWSSPENK